MRRDRVAERRRLSQQEGRRVHKELTRKIRESTIRGLRSLGKATELTSEIERRRTKARRDDVLDTMKSKKSLLLGRVAGCRYVRAKEWQEQLDGLDLTSVAANARLEDLCEEIESGRRFCLALGAEPPVPHETTSVLAFRLKGRPHHEVPGPASTLEQIDLRKRELARRVREDYAQQALDLELIASAVVSLQVSVREYQKQ